MNIPWYRRISVRVLLILFLGSLMVFGASYTAIRGLQVRSRLNTRVNEISRYAVVVASDIALNRYVHSEPAREYEEIDSLSGFFPEARILVLSKQCRVLKDTSDTRRGSTVINDDILSALSGKPSTAMEERYARLAVPIYVYNSTEVDGVIYISFSMERQYQQLQSMLDYTLVVHILAWFLMLLLISLTVIFSFKPLESIVRWLEKVLNGHENKAPEFRKKSEYAAVVRSMNSILSDLQEADSSRKEFVSNVSHELKTPLASIKVLTESLLLDDEATVEDYREFLEDINTEIDRESALVNDLLALVRLEDSKAGLKLEMISVNDLVETILKRLQPVADNKGVSLVLENREQVEAEIDEMKMSIALSNLVENGIKYNKPGGRVRVTVDSDMAEAIVVVSDTGIGISEEHFSKIFQRFYRVDKPRDRATGGTGLGLSIVHQIIAMHHGSISVRSKVDVGTAFTVRIPIIAVQDARLAGKEEHL